MLDDLPSDDQPSIRAASTPSACNPRDVFFQRQVDRTQRRLLSAVRTLAAVRRLALPVNLNVAIAVVGRREPRIA
jgi:hypothetical protein